MFDRRKNIEKPHHATCKWILSTQEYMDWLSGGRSVFWIKGKPGAGKSTVMTFLYNNLKERAEAEGDALSSKNFLSFFFHARGVELQKTPFGMFRSLIYQLVKDGALEDLSNNIVQDLRAKIAVAGRSVVWQLHELQNYFLEISISAAQSRKLTIFIDALDEAEVDEAYALGTYFCHAGDEIIRRNVSVKICISCRHFPAPLEGPSYRACVEDHNKGDIQRYTLDILGNVALFSKSSDLKWKNVVENIIDRACGVFLWVRLLVPTVLRSIAQGKSPAQVQHQIQKTPEDLETVFKHIITKAIETEHRAKSLLLFQWLCFGFRQLSLTEFRFALAADDVDINTSSETCDKTNNFVNSDEQMSALLNTLSGGLAEEIREKHNGKNGESQNITTIQLIHQSVADFLMTQGLQILTDINGQRLDVTVNINAHTALFNSCFRYLVADTESRNFSKPCWELDEIMPFYNYANEFLFDHGIYSGRGYRSVFITNLQDIKRISPILRSAYLKNEDNSEQIGGFEGLKESEYQRSSLLHLAAEAGFLDLIQVLDGHGLQVDEKDWREKTALHRAVESDEDDVVRFLVQAGADVNATYKGGGTALCIASSCHNIGVIKFLLSNDADINIKGGIDGSAVQAAAQWGSKEIVELLLERGADVNAQGGYYGNSLQAAARWGSEEVVELLLERGANVNAQGGIYGNALQAAAQKGSKKIVELLLEKGADINAQGRYHRNALRAAVYKLFNEISKLLLEKGADTKPPVGLLRNPFHKYNDFDNKEGFAALLERGLIEEGDWEIEESFYLRSVSGILCSSELTKSFCELSCFTLFA